SGIDVVVGRRAGAGRRGRADSPGGEYRNNQSHQTLTPRDLFARAARKPNGPMLAGYPPAVRRALFWYDSLTDWQRIRYACVAILFLLACGGYLLGLGSTILLQRVEAE